MLLRHILLAALLVATSRNVAASPDLAAGRQQLQRLQSRRALTSLRRALAQDNRPAVRAEIFVLIGIAQSQLLDEDAAARSFRQALCASPTAKLPEVTSPKIRRLFDHVRSALAGERAVIDRRACGDKTKERAPARGEPVGDKKRAAKPSSGATTADAASSYRWTAWLALGVGAAAAGGAIAFGVLAADDESSASDLERSYGEALSRLDRAKSRATVSNLFVVGAGVSVTTSAVLFWITRKRPTTTVTVLPTPGEGAMLSIRGAAW